MPTPTLPHYMKMYRHKAGFSQKELAALLGCDPKSVRYYERFSQVPQLDTVLACELLFGIPVSLLWAGRLLVISEALLERIPILKERILDQEANAQNARKLEQLQTIHDRLS